MPIIGARHRRYPDAYWRFQGLWFVLGTDDADALRREHELLSWASSEGLLVDVSAKLDLDLGSLDLDAPLADLAVPVRCRSSPSASPGPAGSGLMQTEYEPGTLREKLFGAGPRVPSGPRQVADQAAAAF